MMSQMSPDSPLTFFQNYHTRKAQFKSGIDPLSSRQNRAQTHFLIRKVKRFEILHKRRHQWRQNETNQTPLTESKNQNIIMVESKIDDVQDDQEKELLRRYIHDLHDSDAYVVLAATRGIRKSITRDEKAHISKIFRSYPSLIESLVTLVRHEETLIVTEALWILTNIMSEDIIEHCVSIAINFGVITDLKRLMKHRKGSIRNAALLVMGNMAGDSSNTRDCFLNDSQVLQSL
jgi:hypothetical protein